MNIGFFDSGLGGLTILRATARSLPDYDYLYYGDTANLPYGNKSEEEIYELTKLGMQWLFERDCILIIIACNSASAETLRRLQDNWLPENYPGRKILGVIVPTVECLIETGKTSVKILGTNRTISSEKYLREIMLQGGKDIIVNSVATPELVPFIEAGEVATAVEAASRRIQGEGEGEEVVILGCTHYTELTAGLREQFPNQLFLSQDEIIPEKLRRYLVRHPELTKQLSRTGKRDVHLTEHRFDYDRVMGQFLGGVYVDGT